jgi:hypothetical protein
MLVATTPATSMRNAAGEFDALSFQSVVGSSNQC